MTHTMILNKGGNFPLGGSSLGRKFPNGKFFGR